MEALAHSRRALEHGLAVNDARLKILALLRLGATQIRDVQPLFAEFAMGGAAIAHNGNLTNALSLREELIAHGSIFQSANSSKFT